MKTKSVKIYKQGSSKVLKLEETDIPTLKPNDVLIQHHYFGLNYIDINQRSGSYNIRELPTNVGMEASGIIKEIGSEVKRFKVGDKVTYLGHPGEITKVNKETIDSIRTINNFFLYCFCLCVCYVQFLLCC